MMLRPLKKLLAGIGVVFWAQGAGGTRKHPLSHAAILLPLRHLWLGSGPQPLPISSLWVAAGLKEGLSSITLPGGHGSPEITATCWPPPEQPQTRAALGLLQLPWLTQTTYPSLQQALAPEPPTTSTGQEEWKRLSDGNPGAGRGREGS